MDINAAISHLNKDQVMAHLIEQLPKPVWNPTFQVFQDLIRSITSQQLSVKAAKTIHNRLLDLLGGEGYHPNEVTRQTSENLRAVGLSRQKSQYIQNVATFFLDENLLDENWQEWENEQIIKKLTTIKGVGKWTVQMILMFSIGRSDVFPVDDLGIQQSIIKLYGVEEELKGKALRQKLEDISLAWSPYRTIACRYLWDARDVAPDWND